MKSKSGVSGHLFADLAFEHFFNPEPDYEPDSLLLSFGAGWHF